MPRRRQSGSRYFALHRWLAALTTVLLALSATALAPVAGAQDGAVNDRVKDAMVLVTTTYTGYVEVPPSVDEDGQGFFSDQIEISYTCSGFAVDPSGFIVTAGHCVDPNDESLRIDFRSTFLQGIVDEGEISVERGAELLEQANSEQWVVEGQDRDSEIERVVEVVQPDDPDRVISSPVTVQVVDFQSFDDGDNALLKVGGVGELKPLVVAERSPEVGEQLTAVGFPGNVLGISDGSRVPQPSFKTGTASSKQVLEGGGEGTEINADVSGGMSGGPTINSAGEVIGVNSFGFSEDSGFNFITDAAALRSFLQKNAVTLATPAPEDSSFPWIWMIVAIVGVVIVLVAVVLAIVLSRRSKGGGSGPPGPGGFGGPGGPPTGPTTPHTPPQQQPPWSPTQQWQPHQP